MRTLPQLFILCLYGFISISINSQSLPPYRTNLKKGPFTVGFKSLCLFDNSRTYDLACGDSALRSKIKKPGRPIVLNIWYPARQTHDTAVLKIKDYFDFPADENTALFFSRLKAFQLQYAKLYAVNGNMKEKSYAGDSSSYDNAKDAAFESYISSPTLSHRNAVAADGEFPVIIYHMGIGGTIDENSLLLEYLASNGYIVINSAFEKNDGSGYADGWSVGTGDQRATFDDLDFIINYCKQHNLSKSKKVFLMGHSYGANSSISFIGEGHRNVDGIIPLDSDFGYELANFYPPAFNPFVKDKLKLYTLPVFCIGRTEAHFKMVDSLSLSTRYYLTIPNMRHNDFTSQGAIGRYYCMPYVKEKQLYREVTENYLNMCPVILHFLNSRTKKGAGFDKKDIHLFNGWTFAANKPGEKLPFNKRFDESTQNCPSISQFVDLVFYEGLNRSEKIYARCTDSSFKTNETLLTIFDLLYSEAKADTVIAYLNWMHEQKLVESNLKNIFQSVSFSSLFNTGNGFHFEKADSVYTWMIEKFPTSKYGYIGRLLVSIDTKKDDKEFYCKKILEIEPDFENSKASSYFESKAKQFIHTSRKGL
jgi:hypothetical protein